VAHTDTVQQIYHAFGQGDIQGILNRLAEDVAWEYGARSTDVPWLQPRRGRAQVTEFFHALAALEIRKFQPKVFLENGDVVVALIDVEATVRNTGRDVVEEDEVHIWYFDSAGKVNRFRHRVDTHQQWAAYAGK
jgi:ketosteroid isomerase-like protein